MSIAVISFSVLGSAQAAVGLIGSFFNLPNRGGNSSLLTADATGTIPLESLTPVNTVTSPNIDFGSESVSGPNTFVTVTRGARFGNIFDGIGADNLNRGDYAALFTGSITLTDTAEYQFTTRSDDGSRIWLDLDNDSVFSAAELVADRNFDTGNGNSTGSVFTIPAGTYNFRAGYYERSRESAFQFGFSQRPIGSPVPFAAPTVASPSLFSTLPAPAAVPEPARALLALCGFATAATLRRRKRYC